MIEQKELYTFEELCEGLEISMSKFAKLANVDEGTILRLRRGHLARRGTINSLLRAFSEVYKMKFTLDNVTGLKKVEKPITPIDEIMPTPPSEEKTINATPQPVGPQKSIVEQKKRAYTKQKEKKLTLPEGCILASDFAKAHGVNPRTFVDHMIIGKGPGTVPGEATDPMLPVKDHVEYSERAKPGRESRGEKEKYLTPEQQKAALQFWKRHDVAYSQCERDDCPCHPPAGA